MTHPRMETFAKALDAYDYHLPEELIAQQPARPRDSAKLLVHTQKRSQIADSHVSEIANFLPKNTVLVLNNTKVIPARMTVRRQTGGSIALLLCGTNGQQIRCLSPKPLREEEQLFVQEGLFLTVIHKEGKEWILEPNRPIEELRSVWEKKGDMPLPPYIKHSPLSREELKTSYQTVFAKQEGSIAAPTASLHFTESLLSQLTDQGVSIVELTLHVHLGTFAPLTEQQWQEGALHTEEYHISAESAHLLEKAKQEGRPIIPVGTTAARTLESAFSHEGRCVRPEGTTNLFIREGYQFKMLTGLMTNFHVPRSSLLMLVGSLIGAEQLMHIYQHAITQRYRFYSFGDAMLILP